MMLEKRWQILHALLEKSQKKKVSWEAGPAINMFFTNVGGLGIALRPEGNDLILSLFDKDGQMVESVSDVEFTNAGFHNAYPTMAALYEIAKADATGSEAVVDELLQMLSET